MRTVAVVLAGGSGSRFGALSPKQLRVLAGRNLIEHCVAAFSAASAVDQVLVVAATEIAGQVRVSLQGYGKVADVIDGGATRTDSTRRAIDWLVGKMSASAMAGQPGSHDLAGKAEAALDCKVLIHDAARPLIDQRTIGECVAALDRWQAVGVVVPSADTIVEVADGRMQRILPRASLARCQTPQGFWLSVLSKAYRCADADPDFAASLATDDCGVVVRYLPDVKVGVVQGSERNLKITYPVDLAIAEVLLDAADKDR
jgi:2-C-methyl-D-erythritol 4-phosphate cytidylyltransferase